VILWEIYQFRLKKTESQKLSSRLVEVFFSEEIVTPSFEAFRTWVRKRLLSSRNSVIYGEQQVNIDKVSFSFRLIFCRRWRYNYQNKVGSKELSGLISILLFTLARARCPSTVLVGHYNVNRPFILTRYQAHISIWRLTGRNEFNMYAVTYRILQVWTQHHFVSVPRQWFPGTKCGQHLSLFGLTEARLNT